MAFNFMRCVAKKMKAIIAFDLSDPSDREDFVTMQKANVYKFALEEILERMRAIIKYGEDQKKSEYIEDFRTEVFEILSDRDINLP